jgi:ABC-type transport system substrate-binding protein
MTTSSSAMSTTSSSTSSTSSTNQSGGFRQTLIIDDVNWPYDDLNQLYSPSEQPWPDWTMYGVYQPLIGVDLAQEQQKGNLTFIPALAANWTVSPDGMTYTFNLRHDVHFSNGDPFNAYQVWMQMYGLYYLSGNASNWMYSYSIFNYNNTNFGPATIALINQSGLINPSSQAISIMENQSWPIYVTGPYQIIFHLDSPFLYMTGLFVAGVGLIFDSQYVLDNGGFGAAGSVNTQFNQHPIPGSGPYDVVKVVEDNYVQFIQDPNYWAKNWTQAQITANPIFDPGHAKNVLMYYKPDDLARYTDLSTGAAQVVAIGKSDWNLVLANSNTYSYAVNPPQTSLIMGVALNPNIYPTNITLVRQAIVHAINYSQVNQEVYFGTLTPFVGPNPPIWKQFYNLNNLQPYQYNLTLAQQDLAEANITNFPTISFKVPVDCDYCVNTAQVVQGDLAQIGINVNIEVLATNTWEQWYGNYTTNVNNAAQIGQLSTLGFDWASPALDPADYWLSFMSCTSLWGNWAGYCNPTVQKAVNAFLTTSNVTAIQAAVKAADLQAYNDAPYAWLGVVGLWYADGSLVWQKSTVSGMYLDPTFTGMDTAPLINTVTFTSNS